MTGHNDDPVGVHHHDVPRAYTSGAHSNEFIDSPNLNPVLSGSHEPTGSEHRVVIGQCAIDVSAYTVDHGSFGATDSGILGHDIAPDSVIGPRAVVDDEHVTRSHIVDEVSHVPCRVTRGNSAHSIGRPDRDLFVVGESLNPQDLTVYPELIHSV